MNNPTSRIKISSRWSLEDLLPEGPKQLENILEQIEIHVKRIESFRAVLTADFAVEGFLQLLSEYESLRELTAIVAAYVYLSFAENTQSAQAISQQDHINQILTAVDNRTMFFSLWFKALPDVSANLYISRAGKLHYYLESLRRFKPYTLSEPEEKVINLKDSNGGEALVKIYEIITNGF